MVPMVSMVMCQIQWFLLWCPSMLSSPSRLSGVVLSGGRIFSSTGALPNVHEGEKVTYSTSEPWATAGDEVQASVSYLKAKHAMWPI